MEILREDYMRFGSWGS